MKLVRTENAVGCVLCHDITQIIKGVTKDAVFRKGHIVRQEDIPVLLSVGKEFNVTRERIRQIEAKALRKLRHPSRSKKLKDFLN